jgi:hypothetical protein
MVLISGKPEISGRGSRKQPALSMKMAGTYPAMTTLVLKRDG